MALLKVGTVIKSFWRHMRPYKFWYAALLSIVTVNIVTDVFVPLYYKDLFNELAGNGDKAVAAAAATGTIFIILGLNSIRWVMYRAGGVLDSYLTTGVTYEMDKNSFSKLLEHSYKFFTDNFAGGLMRKVKRYSDAFDSLEMTTVWSLYPLLITLIGSLIVLFGRNVWLGGVMASAVAGILLVNIVFSIWKLKFDLKRAQCDTEASGVLVDAITNSPNIKMFAAKGFEIKKYSEVRDALRSASLRSWLLAEGSFAMQALFMLILEFAVMFTAVKLWQQGVLQIGDFAMIQAYLIAIIERIWNMGKSIRKIYESFADAKELVEILEAPIGVADKPRAKKLKVTQGGIEIDGINFNYNQTRKTLKEFNLVIKPGERIALVGPSGAGKSTMVKLLMRLHDVDAGKIMIDGQNIADVTQDSLREAIGFVPQDPILFHRPIMENVRYGRRSATDKQVMEAAKLAHCHEFISELPEGYRTYVGERGIKLSGGERQRVAIARAILKNAPILILDEATSSLDSHSEALIQDALKNLMAGKTVIVIAHRLSTIMQMDRIVVMQEGKIVDEGTHAGLLARDGMYQKLWNIQAGGFNDLSLSTHH